MNMLQQPLILREAGEPGGGDPGSGVEPPAAPPITNPDPGAWKSALPEEIRNDPTMANVDTVESLAKRHIDGQRFIGKNRMEAPSKNWTPEQYGEFWNKIGRPEKSDGYDFSHVEKPEGLELVDDDVASAREMAHRVGLTNTQFANLMDWYMKFESGRQTTAKEAMDSASTEGESRLKEIWKGEYDTNVDIAKAALKKFGGEELYNYMDQTGIGNDPRMIQAFYSIGKHVIEDSADGKGSGLPVQDATAAKTEISALMSDEKFQTALNNSQHPGHAAAVEKWLDLHRQANPDAAPIT